MGTYLLLIVILGIVFAASGQRPARQTRLRDSLAKEDQRMVHLVDSLHRSALKQDTVLRSIKRLVDMLSASKDTAELAGWKRTYQLEMDHFDSTLTILDSCTGLLNTLNDKMDSLQKRRPPLIPPLVHSH